MFVLGATALYLCPASRWCVCRQYWESLLLTALDAIFEPNGNLTDVSLKRWSSLWSAGIIRIQSHWLSNLSAHLPSSHGQYPWVEWCRNHCSLGSEQAKDACTMSEHTWSRFTEQRDKWIKQESGHHWGTCGDIFKVRWGASLGTVFQIHVTIHRTSFFGFSAQRLRMARIHVQYIKCYFKSQYRYITMGKYVAGKINWVNPAGRHCPFCEWAAAKNLFWSGSRPQCRCCVTCWGNGSLWDGVSRPVASKTRAVDGRLSHSFGVVLLPHPAAEHWSARPAQSADPVPTWRNASFSLSSRWVDS